MERAGVVRGEHERAQVGKGFGSCSRKERRTTIGCHAARIIDGKTAGGRCEWVVAAQQRETSLEKSPLEDGHVAIPRIPFGLAEEYQFAVVTIGQRFRAKR